MPNPTTAIAAGPGERLAYRVADVAQMTGVSLRRLLDSCRSGEVDHIRMGGRRLMTQAQIDAMLTQYSTGITAEAKREPVDELEQARVASRRNASRQTARRTG